MSKIGNQLERFLVGIGRIHGFSEAQGIADFLTDLGYQGVKSNACDCPITRFVKDCIGDPEADIRTNGILVTYRWQDDDGGGLVEVGASDAQSAFVDAFDHGEYPDLIDTESRTPDPVEALKAAVTADAPTEAEPVKEPEPVPA